MQAFDISIPSGTLVETELEAQHWLEYFQNAAKYSSLGIDSETTGLTNFKDIVIVWSLSDGKHRVCFSADHLELFRPLLENPNVNFDFTNAKYDAHMFANCGIDLSKAGEWRDTSVMSWLLNENNLGRHGLKECVMDHFGRRTPTFEEVFGPKPKKSKANPVVKTMGEIIRDHFQDPEKKIKAMDYATLDSFNSRELRVHFDKKLKEIGLYDYFYAVEVPFTKVLWKMERRGVMMDLAYLQELQAPMEKEMEEIEKEFAKEAGWIVNLNSPVQITKFFIEHLKKKVIKYTKGGKTGVKKPSTDEEVLQAWAEDGDIWAEKLLKHRKISKMYGTYVMGLQEWIDPQLRIHSGLNQHGTVTGRLSSSDPNLQNIPRFSEDRFGLREAFMAGEGYKLIVADYAQLEMRLMAHFSGDQKMIKAIRDGVDLHCLTVAEMNNIPYETVIAAVKAEKAWKKGKLGRDLTQDEESLLFMRQCAKSTGFGIIYGIGGKLLAANLTAAAAEDAKKRGVPNTRFVSEEEGEELIQKWLDIFPGVRAYIENTHDFMKKNGFVQTIVGRFRRFGDMKGMSFRDRARAERQGVNSVIQGTASDIAKVVMIAVENDPLLNSLGCRLLLQVHDELIWECPDDEEVLKKAKERIEELMSHPFDEPLAVDVPAEANHGYSWATAK